MMLSDISQQSDILWLLAGVDIPVILSLIIAIIRYYKETEKRFSDHEKMCDLLRLELDKKLIDQTLKMSNEYARISVVREIERRVVSHLLRIESKLDVTALKAEAVHFKINKDKQERD